MTENFKAGSSSVLQNHETITALINKWLPKQKQPYIEKKRVILFCFHHAGGGASVFHNWGQWLPPFVEVRPIQLPGRENRVSEPALTSAEAIASALVPILVKTASMEFAFFGHSMGGLLAFEVARELHRRSLREPRFLFLSGVAPPEQRNHDEKNGPFDLSRKSRVDLLRELEVLGGTPAQALEDSELVDIVLSALRVDLGICETYAPVPGPPLDCQLVALIGDNDPVASLADMNRWQNFFHKPIEVRELPGGHFYFKEHPERLMKMLGDSLTGLLEQNQPGRPHGH